MNFVKLHYYDFWSKEWIGDVSASNISSLCGNHIKASAAYMVFNIDSGGMHWC